MRLLLMGHVVWPLRDITQEDAGFTVVPATRKGGDPTTEGITNAAEDPLGVLLNMCR
ncbi:MAG: hypothetical protein ACJ0UT_08220 [Candidatus Latescibacterota bacterium]